MGGPVTADIWKTDGSYALPFTMPDETWTIADAIFVGSRDNVAVYSNADRSLLNNNGNILSASSYGVYFNSQAGESDVSNGADASIAGLNTGILLKGVADRVFNAGRVIGYEDSGILISSDFCEVHNQGEVLGEYQGVFVNTPGGALIGNSGLIRGTYDAGIVIEFERLPGTGSGTTTINNSATGIIKNGIAANFTGNIVLTNLGTVEGPIRLQFYASTDDVIVSRGAITGNVLLGPGKDTFNGAGGISPFKVFGGEGNDLLIGGNANDVLHGDAGNDVLRGRLGKDLLVGGSERDLFDFNSIADSVVGANRDVVADFTHGNNTTGDDIDLTNIDANPLLAGNQAFTFIGTRGFHGIRGELRFTDLGTSCLVQGDTNGNGAADFEIMVRADTLFAGDFLL